MFRVAPDGVTRELNPIPAVPSSFLDAFAASKDPLLLALWNRGKLLIDHDGIHEEFDVSKSFGNYYFGTRKLSLSEDGHRVCAGMIRKARESGAAIPSAGIEPLAILALVSLGTGRDNNQKSSIEFVDLPSGVAIWTLAPSGDVVYADSHLSAPEPQSGGTVWTSEPLDEFENGAVGANNSDLPNSVQSWALALMGQAACPDSKPGAAELRPVLKYTFGSDAKWKKTGILCQGRCTSIAVSPDGSRIAVSEERTAAAATSGIAPGNNQVEAQVVVWSPDGRVITRLSQHGPTRSLGFSSRGMELVTADSDAIHVWNLGAADPQNAEIARFVFNDSVKEVGFSRDDRSIIVVGASQVEAYYFKPDEILADACRRIGRDLTHEEWNNLVPNEPYEAVCLHHK